MALPTDTTSRASAFTLLELIVVLALMALLSAIAVPMVANFERGQRSVDAADQIVALARFARSEAVTRGISYRLNIDPGPGQYWLSMQNGSSNENTLQNGQSSGLGTSAINTTQTQFAQTGNDLGLKFTLPQGVRLDGKNIPSQADGQYVEFHPTGRVDPGTIRLVERTGKTIEVGTLSAVETFHVLTSEEQGMERSVQLPLTGGPAR